MLKRLTVFFGESMSKKIIALILSLMTCIACVACGGSKNSDSGDTSTGISSEGTSESIGDSTSEDSEETSESDGKDSSETEKKEVKVTFQQSGVEDIIITIEEGAPLTSVPTPTEKTGYTIVWNRKDFSSITEDITVKAIETAKTYTIKLQANGGNVAQETLTVTYGQTYELPMATHNEHIFEAWTYAGEPLAMQGTWELDAEAIVLTVQWNECCWSGNY